MLYSALTVLEWSVLGRVFGSTDWSRLRSFCGLFGLFSSRCLICFQFSLASSISLVPRSLFFPTYSRSWFHSWLWRLHSSSECAFFASTSSLDYPLAFFLSVKLVGSNELRIIGRHILSFIFNSIIHIIEIDLSFWRRINELSKIILGFSQPNRVWLSNLLLNRALFCQKVWGWGVVLSPSKDLEHRRLCVSRLIFFSMNLSPILIIRHGSYLSIALQVNCSRDILSVLHQIPCG